MFRETPDDIMSILLSSYLVTAGNYGNRINDDQ